MPTVHQVTAEASISTANRQRPFRRLTTTTTLLIAAGIVAVGILLLYLGGRDDLWETRQGAQALVTDLGALMFVSAGLGVLWELVGKRSFAREVLETARTSTDVEAAGLTRVGTNYVEEPDWEALFATVRKLDIFLAYGRTWRNAHLQRLERLAMTPGARIRVFLPDPGDPATIGWLAQRFSMTPDNLRQAIEEARQAYQALPVVPDASVEVFYRRGESVFSCYRFDGTAVFTLYTHQRRRTGVPTFVCRDGGSLYQFIRDEFDAILSQSVPAPLGPASTPATPPPATPAGSTIVVPEAVVRPTNKSNGATA